MAQATDEIQQWCDTNGFGDLAEGLKEYVECLADLCCADDKDIVEIVTGLKLPMKKKLKFKKAVKALSQSMESQPGFGAAVKDNTNEKESKTEDKKEFEDTNNNGNGNKKSGIVFTAELKENKENKDDEKKEINTSEGIKVNMPTKAGVYVIPTINKKDIGPNWKTIMVIGETGSGKSTTLNSMINYLWNVSLDDHYRFVLIPPPSDKSEQGKSVTNRVTCYHFKPPMLNYGLTVVDTPGFGDTSGGDMDSQIVKMIEKKFKNDLDTIDAVFFVLKSSQSRLTAMQRYVFNSMLRLFGKDIESNLFLLITFCDGADPPVYASVKSYDLPYSDAFELNNSAFFTGFDDYFRNKNGQKIKQLDFKKDCFESLNEKEKLQWLQNRPKPLNKRKTTAMFWDMGMDAMKNLFDTLRNTQTKTTTLCREVLQLRNHLQLRIESLHTKITDGLNLISSIRQIIDIIKVHAKDVNQSQDFEIEVDTTKQIKVDTTNNTTTCLNCNHTCHENCAYDDNSEKQKCCAMNSNGYCSVCPGGCFWGVHKNKPWIFQNVPTKKTVTKEALKKKFDESTLGMTTSERIVISQTEEIMEKQFEISTNIVQVRSCIEKLGEIALKPCVMEEDEYYALMIQSEEDQKEPNYKERIKTIKQLREQAKQVRLLQMDETKGQETAQLFDSHLKKLQKDLQEIKVIQGDAPQEARKVLQRVTNRLQKTHATFVNQQKENQKKINKDSILTTMYNGAKSGVKTVKTAVSSMW